MYQVFLTKGEYEPWWFFEDWKTLIVEQTSFNEFEEALQKFNEIFNALSDKYPIKKTKNSYLSAFWTEDEMVFCESCDDDIQIFHGVMLLKDEQIIN